MELDVGKLEVGKLEVRKLEVGEPPFLLNGDLDEDDHPPPLSFFTTLHLRISQGPASPDSN